MNELANVPGASGQFPPSSRYRDAETVQTTLPDGRTVLHLRRRMLPRPEGFDAVLEHRVRDGDRLDLLAAEFYGDPLLAWRLCDANGAMRPSDLTDTPGARLRIAAPQNPRQAP